MKDLEHLQRIIKELQNDKDNGKLGDYAQGRLAAFKMSEKLVKNLTIHIVSNSVCCDNCQHQTPRHSIMCSSCLGFNHFQQTDC